MQHDTLNPKLWLDNNTLKPEVRSKILEITKEFQNYLEIPINFIDVHLLGSNASYNYNENSDLDVHVIVNFDYLNAPDEWLQIFFNLQKKSFNDEYDIKIKGIDVELYVEDVNAGTISNGIYSVFKNKWIKKPTYTIIPKVDLEPELSNTREAVLKVISNDNLELAQRVLDNLYMLRKNSLARAGEYSKGNLIFKAIRNEGLLDLLKDRIKQEISKELSLESLKLKKGIKNNG